MTAAAASREAIAERAARGILPSPEEALALAGADLFLLGGAADGARARIRGDGCALVLVRRFRWDGAPVAPLPVGAPGSAEERPDELRFDDPLPDGAGARDVIPALLRARELHPDAPVRAVRPAELARFAARSSMSVTAVLGALAGAGVAALAHPLPSDDPAETLSGLTALAGGPVAADAPYQFDRDAGPQDLVVPLLAFRAMVGAAIPLRSVVPLPAAPPDASPLEGTTGTDDLRAFALARLLSPDRLRVVVEAAAVGPKLGAVALSFGADTLAGAAAEPTPRLTAADGEKPRPFNAPRARRLIEEAGRTVAAAPPYAVARIPGA